MRYLIDGHNLIGRLPDISLRDPDDELALIERLHVYAQRTRKPIAVVFDAGINYVPPQRPTYSDVRASYARQGQTADQLILNRVKKAHNPREMTVVTSDRELAGKARAAGALVMTAEEFMEAMQPAPQTPDADELEAQTRANVRLSTDEVEEWLDLFTRKKRRPR